MSEFVQVPPNSSASTMLKSDPEKQESVVTVQAVSDQIPWESGIRKRFPWVGFGAIMVVLNCTMATLLVLKFSNNKSATGWCNGVIEPNVFLSIFNSIANIAITVAVANGIAIAWWRRALAGQTMKELHYSWSFSMSFMTIFTKFRYFNIIALAALAAKIAVIDSVLYQRSLGTSIEIGKTYDNKTYSTFAAQVFPITASMGPTPDSIGVLQSAFYYNFNTWWQTSLLSNYLTAIAECNAYQCEFGLPAAGFSVECTDSWQLVDYGISAPKALALNQSSGYRNLPVFASNWSFSGVSSEVLFSSIQLQMTYTSSLDNEDGDNGSDSSTDSVQYGSCPTNLTTSTCVFRPAVLNYTVVITNQKSPTKFQLKNSGSKQNSNGDEPEVSENSGLTVPYNAISVLGLNCNSDDSSDVESCGGYDTSWRQIAGIKVMKSVDVVEAVAPYANSTLYGFYLAFKDYFTASATIDWNGKDWSYFENGQFASLSGQEPNPQPEGYCNYSSYDMRSDVLQRINMLTLMVATDPTGFYNYKSDFGENATDSLTRAVYWSNSDNYTSLIDNENIGAGRVFAATFDLNDPLSVFDPKQVGLQKTVIHKLYKDVFYKTDWNYTYGAIAATALVILCIIPVYWKFWELGRRVTLGPFEIANAFGSPAFSGIHPGVAGEADVVLKHVGRNKVKYVEVTDETGRKYAFQPYQG